MFKKLTEDARLPERATKYSAGFDVYSNDDVVIGAGETVLVGLGICLDSALIDDMVYKKLGIGANSDDFKRYCYLELHPRSSLRAKGLGGGVGIIDIDYRDEIKMVISMPYNESYLSIGLNIKKRVGYKVKKGDKIGQLILKRHEGWLLPDEYTKDAERTGGFGSTGE